MGRELLAHGQILTRKLLSVFFIHNSPWPSYKIPTRRELGSHKVSNSTDL